MRVIDFNLHLPAAPSLTQELDTRLLDLPARLSDLTTTSAALGIERGNVMILDPSFLRRDPAAVLHAIDRSRFSVTVMLDPRQPDAVRLVADHARLIDGVKFHPYLLNLADYDFPAALEVGIEAARHGLWLAVDCSYGTSRVYDLSGVRLVLALARTVRTPVVALHGGGPRVLDLLGAALELPHIVLDTSFSIPYWEGSSVETDYAFAIRKLGAGRWLYGSDHPYISIAEARAATPRFLVRHGFTSDDVDAIMFRTADALMRKVPL